MKHLRLLRLTSLLVLIALASLVLAQSSPAVTGDVQRILVFGDSNSWGWIPQENAIPTERYSEENRWPGVAQQILGENYEIIVDGLSGRTTDVHDPGSSLSGAGLNGAEALPAVIGSHLPLDLVVLFLGTNDTKVVFDHSPLRIGMGAASLISIVQNSGEFFGDGWYVYPAPRVLLVAPPPLGEPTVLAETFDDMSVERSEQLAAVYNLVAEQMGVAFFDAGEVIETDGVDAVHFSAETHQTLGEALAEEIQALMSENSN